jgi:hypothetical protein
MAESTPDDLTEPTLHDLGWSPQCNSRALLCYAVAAVLAASPLGAELLAAQILGTEVGVACVARVCLLELFVIAALCQFMLRCFFPVVFPDVQSEALARVLAKFGCNFMVRGATGVMGLWLVLRSGAFSWTHGFDMEAVSPMERAAFLYVCSMVPLFMLYEVCSDKLSTPLVLHHLWVAAFGVLGLGVLHSGADLAFVRGWVVVGAANNLCTLPCVYRTTQYISVPRERYSLRATAVQLTLRAALLVTASYTLGQGAYTWGRFPKYSGVLSAAVMYLIGIVIEVAMVFAIRSLLKYLEHMATCDPETPGEPPMSPRWFRPCSIIEDDPWAVRRKSLPCGSLNPSRHITEAYQRPKSSKW